MTEAVRKIIERRNAVWSRMQELLGDAEKRSQGLAGEELENYRKAETEFDALTEELGARQRAEAHEATLGQPQPIQVGGAETPAEGRSVEAGVEEARAKAFNKYIRRGLARLTDEERGVLQPLDYESPEFRDLSDVTGGAGGYTVPQGFLAKITERQKYFGPMRLVANKITTTSGQPLPWVANDDTGTVAAVLAENTAVSEADPTFTPKQLNAYVWSSGLVRVPNTLLNDSAFDIETFLTNLFARRFGRGQNTAFTSGAGHGSNTAQGIVPGLQAGANLFATTAGATAITYADILNLTYAIDPAYRTTASFMFSDGAMHVLHALTDLQGRPLFVPAGSFGGIADAQPQDTLLGHKLFINNDLAAVTATNVTGIFGDFERAYIIRDVLDMQTVRLAERYAEYLQTGFFAFMRTDAIVDDSNAAALLIQHA